MFRQALSRDLIRDLIRDRIDVRRRGVGGIIGVIEPAGEFTVGYGRLAHGTSVEVADDTIFELGCVSKVLTALLCAEMVERAEIRLSDPVADYLPSGVDTIGRNGVAITFEHLVTHRAGLPRRDHGPSTSIEQLYALMCQAVPRQDVGLYPKYSTPGFAILGLALGNRLGSTHAALVRERVCMPLGMIDTCAEVPSPEAPRLAAGHDAALMPVPPQAVPAATGGYGFHSTASDLMRLLSACAETSITPLNAAIRRTMFLGRACRPQIPEKTMAWQLQHRKGVELFVHPARSSGHRIFIGVAPAFKRATLALINGVAPVGLDDIGRHLLDTAWPLVPGDSELLRPARLRPPRQLAVSSRQLNTYVGVYQLTPRARVEVVRDDAGPLVTRGAGSGQRIYPHGEDEFWLPARGQRLDCLIRFERAGARVTMIVEDPAETQRLMRVDAQPPSA